MGYALKTLKPCTKRSNDNRACVYVASQFKFAKEVYVKNGFKDIGVVFYFIEFNPLFTYIYITWYSYIIPTKLYYISTILSSIFLKYHKVLYSK